MLRIRPRASIPVIEWVDTLELIVDEGHFDQWIYGQTSGVVDETVKVGHQLDNSVMVLWRRIDDFPGSQIAQSCSGKLPKAGIILFQCSVNLKNLVHTNKMCLADRLEADAQRGHIAGNLLGGWIGGLVGQLGFEEIVVGGDDVLDFGAVFRFLKCESLDEDGFVRDSSRDPFEFCKVTMGFGQFPENCLGF